MKKSYRFILVLVLLVVLGAGWTGLTRRSFSEGGPQAGGGHYRSTFT